MCVGFIFCANTSISLFRPSVTAHQRGAKEEGKRGDSPLTQRPKFTFSVSIARWGGPPTNRVSAYSRGMEAGRRMVDADSPISQFGTPISKFFLLYFIAMGF